MTKKILVVYYTQTGQLRNIVQSLTKPLADDGAYELHFEELKPKPPFPFPYNADEFFQVMPESVAGIPCELEPLSLKGDEHFDLVMVAWQPWYLSPSIPIHAFFQHTVGKALIKGKPIVTIVGSRNMWVMAHETIRGYIREAGGRLVGNILFYDKAPNLLSVVSVIRWMFHGKSERYLWVFPPSGVSAKDIAGASVYGEIIGEAFNKGGFDTLQQELVAAGAVDVKTSLAMIEKRGKVMFRIWADFIRRKGAYGAKSRVLRVRMFKYYLLFVIYLVSPLASAVYWLIKPFRKKTIQQQISLYQSVSCE